ncbi:SH3 domain-containing protein [Phormidium sp. CCY1219]|uniref:SH3 domain-containing protein n=1 Tax=Phormidium sp. CCY1219 TaxID=2886104 RepID=UPI002D1E7A6B|nr:SH3 domain-containing protein [Phormidium sp. CCY1219]MEB3830702.1 hypothetical protein [Phormidium sp. CCY1219]
MKVKSNWRNSLLLTSIISLAASGLGGAVLPQQAKSQNIQPAIAQAKEFRVAQVSNACREVSKPGGITVLIDPRPDSAVVGEIPNNEQVAIDGPGAGGWVSISAPYQGYVRANDLAYCPESASPPINDCREVLGEGATVWQTPSFESGVVGNLDFREQVAIENRGQNGWVPIYAPFEGYIQANNLGYCESTL